MLPSTDRFFTIFLMTLYILGCLFLISYCGTSPGSSAASPTSGDVPVYTYKIVNTYPHDRNAFTQGLVFEDGVLYESTGLRGRSTLRKVELETGKLFRCCKLPSQFFGEGLAVCGNRLIQLTWQSGTGFVYDKSSFALVGTFKYPTEGWGLTHDGTRLIMSDGTSSLYFLDPGDFGVTGKIGVYDDRGPVTRINELEYVRGEIYANVWQTDHIVRIDPGTGQVTGRIDLEGLLSPEDTGGYRVDVLNGIAYDTENDRLFVTGKLWPKLFEIELRSAVPPK
ncbi:glutaminyl-peptide cyclotransferase [Desulfobacterales bacterium HSG2]|nr:glutaminyl-peptide cyclotransferase [Desulfobacterales bacterium HSG2]